MRGYRTKYRCKCGGKILETRLEGKLICPDCYKDHGYMKNES